MTLSFKQFDATWISSLLGQVASAKAILYYITDYITKTQLKAHGAYVALKAAVTKLENEINPDIDVDDYTLKAKRMLVKCANALLAKQELSGPQVASYLMDYGDHYTSHLFRILFWSNFERIVTSEEGVGSEEIPSPDGEDDDTSEDHNQDSDNSHDSDQFVFVERSAGRLHSDERKSGSGLPFPRGPRSKDYVCGIYFVSQTEKSSMQYLKRYDSTPDDEDDSDEDDGFQSPGRKSLARDRFKDGHPESKTHFLRIRSVGKEYVPVPLGRSIYRRDREDCREEYCRLMLVLFKPWRCAADLKAGHESWESAFHSFMEDCPPALAKVMENMQRLHECKDSRDDHYQNRRLRRRTRLQSDEFTASLGGTARRRGGRRGRYSGSFEHS